MGGYGSGRWHCEVTRQTVESCTVLDVNRIRRDGSLYQPSVGMNLSGSITWRNVTTGEQTAAVGYRMESGGGRLIFRLLYTVDGQDVDEPVEIDRRPQPFGGLRWWFRCPLSVGGRFCGRRCGKLYLPPGGRYFGCRLCYNLTYRSCNESHQFDNLYRVVAGNMGYDWRAVKEALEHDSSSSK